MVEDPDDDRRDDLITTHRTVEGDRLRRWEPTGQIDRQQVQRR